MSTTKTVTKETTLDKTQNKKTIKKHRIYEFAKKASHTVKPKKKQNESLTTSGINEIKELVKMTGDEVKQQTQAIRERLDHHFNMVLEPNTKALIDKFSIPLDSWQQYFIKNDLDDIQSNLEDPEFQKKLQKVKVLKNTVELKKKYKLYHGALSKAFVSELTEIVEKIPMQDIIQFVPFLHKVRSFIDEVKVHGINSTKE